MGISSTMEKAFEDTIVNHLSAHGWLTGTGNAGASSNAGWDKARALYIPDVLHWLETQYPEEFAKAVPESSTGVQRDVHIAKLLDRLTEMLDKAPILNARTKKVQHGLLGTLRNGFSHAQRGQMNATFGPMVAFHPENPLYTSAVEQARHNRLRVLRQVPFDVTGTDTLDLVLTVNGIPVATLELKTDNTQAVRDAVKQYKQDRKPTKNRPLLKPGRALVHFAVSNQEVYMTTVLAGLDTFFLPFNQGNDGHAGNPVNPTGSDTAYLWEEVFAPDLFLRILRDYALWEPSSKGNKGRLIFPRYHQLRATEKVIDDIAERARTTGRGAGGRYLIQHSAGSGKTKTIAWLAHRAGRVIDMAGKPVFDSVIVVTDRTVLDDNIKEGLDLLRASEGLVVNVNNELGSKSKTLEAALSRGGHIISCTIQTFPALAKMMEKSPALSGRNYCVIMDEAHSSQHGEAATRLREILVDVEVPEGEDIGADDVLLAMDKAVTNSPNLSFIALTATPKAKTLAAYGAVDPHNPDRRVAFDTYQMSQAIEEGFILDVLANYSTYQMFASIRDALGREETVNFGEAVSDMVRFVRLHPTSIAQKVEVTVEHFRRNVMHHLGGTAKAMVVAADRMSAATWSHKMNEYIAKRGYTDMTTLVAFSGSLTYGKGDEAMEVTEASMNGVRDTAGHFREHDEAKVLIVANKFQTGFDEPRLCAMYVDRKLSGVQAVQTLSRLNRVFPDKPKPMVVDFINEPSAILESFRPYYRDAYIEDEIPANALADLGDVLDAAAFYTPDELDKLADAYIAHEDAETLQGLVAPIRARWNDHMRDARLKLDKEAYDTGKSFRANLIKYTHAWEFLSQIVDFQDALLHKRAIVAGLLAKNLNLERQDDDDDYTVGIELVGVSVEPTSDEQDLELAAYDPEGKLRLPGFDGRPVGSHSPVQAAFDEAVDQVNQLLAKAGLDSSNQAAGNAVRASYGILAADTTVQALTRENDPTQVAGTDTFRNKGLGAIVTAARQSNEVFEAVTADPENLEKFLEVLAHMLVAARQDERNNA
ncbi:type I restriction endonuclease [Corynebacterium sp. ES2794-CONJ1]|uniref:type I restriction endonuclease subunit R n=1 Tax=Corynebacterium sp. ES2794-CONJ1 TaxID=2980553 RepID=UPI0021D93EDE|nr:type I restriction endonuclease [Corynebacterium sp. ES2794-CONJ1]MCU9518746.1 type I restriction endonuclease [Corynebacterium sp. ES2794-CONJ1]